jgi:hypothetical protein
MRTSVSEPRRRLPSVFRVKRAIPAGVVLGVAVGAEAALLAGGSHAFGWLGLALVLLASAAWAFASWDARIDARPHVVVGAIALAFVFAIAAPPRQSRDLWSYAAYGRMVTTHHVSPYQHGPNEFPHDPFSARVGTGWQGARSVYGPLFTGGSAAIMRVAGDSALRARLLFQSLAALAVAAALALLWRATRSARSLVFLGLHPALVLGVVNNGHNDAFVGLAVLGAALLAARRRWNGAGVVLGPGLLVKASTGLGLLGIAAWTYQRDRRGAARLVLVAALTTLLGYLPAGAAAVRAVAHAGNGNTRTSAWDVLSLFLPARTPLAIALVLTLAVSAVVVYGRAARPGRTAVATTAAYLVGGLYVLPSYTAWALPSAALERRTKLSVLVALQAAFLVAVYQFEPTAHPMLTGVAAVARTGIIQIGAWAALIAFVVLLRRAARRPSPVLT